MALSSPHGSPWAPYGSEWAWYVGSAGAETGLVWEALAYAGTQLSRVVGRSGVSPSPLSHLCRWLPGLSDLGVLCPSGPCWTGLKHVLVPMPRCPDRTGTNAVALGRGLGLRLPTPPPSPFSALWGASVGSQHWVVPTGHGGQDWGAGGQAGCLTLSRGHRAYEDAEVGGQAGLPGSQAPEGQLGPRI